MNNTKIDLNLFSIFHAVMAERSVTRAAQRLGMTQPSVSNALSRLRHLFRDELFTKVRGGMEPTERAVTIWPEVHDAIEKISLVIGPPEFEPATSGQIFNLAITDALRYSLVPALAVHLATQAPHVKLHLNPHTTSGSISDLEAGRLDCAIGMFPQLPPGLHADSLFADNYVCALRKGHPLLRHHLTLKALGTATYVLVKMSGASQGLVDSWFSLKGLTRHITLVVNHFEDALEVVRQTDLITAIPHRLAGMAHDANCEVVKLPFDTGGILYKMLWHDKSDKNPAHVWLRAVIRDLLLKRDISSYMPCDTAHFRGRPKRVRQGRRQFVAQDPRLLR